MFSYEVLKDDGVVVLTTTGETTFDDYQSIAPRFFSDVEEMQIRKLLVDDRRFTGWASGNAKSLAFMSWIEGRAMFDRIALVVHNGGTRELPWFLELFGNTKIDVRVFPQEKFGDALDWLKHDGTTDE